MVELGGVINLEGTNSNFSAIPWYYDGGSGTQYDPNPFDGSVIFQEMEFQPTLVYPMFHPAKCRRIFIIL